MTVFIDTSGLSDVAFGDLFTATGSDSGLGEVNVPTDSTVFQVTYVETAGAPATADRINQLVNTDFGVPIVISALNDGTDPITGIDLTTVAGETYIDSSSGISIVRVVYDASQCLGSGFFVFDVNGKQITFPGPVLLYHELSHALRAATGTTQSNDEIPAETDENVLRSQEGLCLRDVNNHGGGCGAGDTCGGTVNGCFIVSATTGSPESEEVQRLRALRELVAGTTGLGATLIERIYAEYYQFSPAIAGRLGHDALARQAVLLVAVRPLLAWYTLAGILAFDGDGNGADQAMRDLERACPRYLGRTSVAGVLAGLRAGQPLPDKMPPLLHSFAADVRKAAVLPNAGWAILDPLARAWGAAGARRDVRAEVAQWLADAPLDQLARPAEALLDGELAALAGLFDFRPDARRALGARLALAWPQAISALARHGFI
ncbi:hypothetical protein [Rugamonas apoptosis]|uniref:Uncharacterized protein n=1 Tax=Rugamonas apoptosis TaxID=2758570 RepID=A0A7W2FDG2_9BURK|nr:hypothetical protein [Rugamonas apoptosis]MBA5689559.1 hypothetical protein [Rugamonas apoptosis]